MTAEETNRTVMRSIYEGYSRGDASPMLGALAEDVRFGRNGRGWGKGMAVSEAIFGANNEGYEWVEFGCEEIICEADRAVAVLSGRIAHTATGAVSDLDLVDIVRFRDGKIVEFMQYVDTTGLRDEVRVAQRQAERAHQTAVAARKARRAGFGKAKVKAKVKAKPKTKPEAKPKAKPKTKTALRAKSKTKAKAKRRTSRRR